jgi:integrase
MRRSQTAIPAATSIRGRARLRLNGRTFYLGRFGSPEAHRLEDRIVGVYLAHGRMLPADFKLAADPAGAEATTTPTSQPAMPVVAAPAPAAALPPAAVASAMTVGELCLRWIAWIEAERMRPGTDTSLLAGARQAAHCLRRHWHMLARDFGPRALAEARLALANEPCRPGGGGKKKPAAAAATAKPARPRKDARKPKPPKPPRYRSRSTVNDTIGRVRQMFRWAVARELVGPDRLHALQALEPLHPGQTKAIERPPVEPVGDEVFEATLRHLSPVVADLLRVARLTATRPGEICRITARDIDMSKPVWVYAPPHHKNQWRGHERQVAIGPRAQAILRRYIGNRAIDAPLFSPREAIRGRGRRVSRIVRPHYDADTVRRAVERACADHGLPHWTPNRLRHARLEEVRDDFGLDAAQAVGGHKHARVTEIYARTKREKAVAVALQTG